MKLLQHTVILEESLQIKVNLHGKKLIKVIYLNCNLEKTSKFLLKKHKIIKLSKWALAHFFLGRIKCLIED